MKKWFLILVKWIPFVLSILVVIQILCNLIGMPATFCSILGDTSLLPLLFILIASFLFKFCLYHRIFIYYLLYYDIITWLDYIFVFSLSSKIFISINLLLFAIIFAIALYLYLKRKPNIKIKKRWV